MNTEVTEPFYQAFSVSKNTLHSLTKSLGVRWDCWTIAVNRIEHQEDISKPTSEVTLRYKRFDQECLSPSIIRARVTNLVLHIFTRERMLDKVEMIVGDLYWPAEAKGKDSVSQNARPPQSLFGLLQSSGVCVVFVVELCACGFCMVYGNTDPIRIDNAIRIGAVVR